MLYRILTFAFGSLLAGGQTVVSVCNLASVPKSIVQHAQAEVVAVFARAGVTIEWLACDKPGHALVVRLRRTRPAASTTEDQLGRAFLDPEGHGSLADVYFNPVREFASANEAETNAVLGYVIAHELGRPLVVIERPATANRLADQILAAGPLPVVLGDEVHLWNQTQQHDLMDLADRQLLNTPTGPAHLPGVSLIAATTNPEKLVGPLLSRIGCEPRFQPYTDQDLDLIVAGMAYPSHFLHRRHAFAPHVWMQAWNGARWVSFDAALGRFDAGHVALAVGDGSPADFAGVVAIMSKMRIVDATGVTSEAN